MLCVLWLGLLLPLALAQDNTQVTESTPNPLHAGEVSDVATEVTEVEMTPVQAIPCAEVVGVQQMDRLNSNEAETHLECSPRCCCELACILPVVFCAIVMCIFDGDLGGGSRRPPGSNQAANPARSAIDDNHISFEFIEEYSADAEATAEFSQIGSQIN